MAQSTVRQVTHYADGRILVEWGKRGIEFANMEALRAWVEERINRETLDALALRTAIKANPGLRNPALVNGRRAVVDFDTATPRLEVS